ncbi:MAG: BrnT family toxin [Ardenticatenaceae bacterium]|nr:BrnT family toxin [Ardenticatenaceae bacterium]
MEFEWDPTKAASNLRKHHVSFTEATSIFYDVCDYTGVRSGKRMLPENRDPKADQTATPCLRIVER